MALEVVKNLYAVEPHRWGDSLLKPQRWCNRNWSHITTSLDPNSHPLYQIVVKIIHVVLLILPTIASYSLGLISILIKSITANNEKSDLIPEQLKTTLDVLLGGSCSVDKLPTYIDKISNEHPICQDAMTASIMKGTTDQNIPFIVIKMRCLSSQEEIIEKLGKPSRRFDFSKPIEHVLFLHQYRNDLPLMWDQFHDNSEYVYPNFFSGNFTVPEDGTVAESQQQYFSNMQEIIQKGIGEDINGIRWNIIP